MEITLNHSTEVVVVPEKKVTLTTLTINRMVDLPTQKKVVAFIKELNQPVVLWEGDAYDAIGQWTDTDVTTRLNVIYS